MNGDPCEGACEYRGSATGPDGKGADLEPRQQDIIISCDEVPFSGGKRKVITISYPVLGNEFIPVGENGKYIKADVGVDAAVACEVINLLHRYLIRIGREDLLPSEDKPG